MTANARSIARTSSDCIAAEELDMPGAHRRCLGNGAIYLPGSGPGSAPVLPKIPCGCDCHQKESQ
jgi:hypothetical protein